MAYVECLGLIFPFTKSMAAPKIGSDALNSRCPMRTRGGDTWTIPPNTSKCYEEFWALCSPKRNMKEQPTSLLDAGRVHFARLSESLTVLPPMGCPEGWTADRNAIGRNEGLMGCRKHMFDQSSGIGASCFARIARQVCDIHSRWCFLSTFFLFLDLCCCVRQP